MARDLGYFLDGLGGERGRDLALDHGPEGLRGEGLGVAADRGRLEHVRLRFETAHRIGESVRSLRMEEEPAGRTLAARLVKSWTAPIRTTPRAIQSKQGTQPNARQAAIGPAIGQAAAIAEKCWPKR